MRSNLQEVRVAHMNNQCEYRYMLVGLEQACNVCLVFTVFTVGDTTTVCLNT